MAETGIEITGLDAVRRRFKSWPRKYDRKEKELVDNLLLVLQEKVPEYPNPPAGSTYRRTNMLGRSLSATSHGFSGHNNIWENKPIRGGRVGRFGTNLIYAQHVIGTRRQARHMSHWWRMSQVLHNARPKLKAVLKTFIKVMARHLDG